MNRKIKGLIFDLDGVLVTTEHNHFIAWKNTAEILGIPFNEEDNEQLKGISRLDSLKKILELGNKFISDETFNELLTKKNEYYLNSIAFFRSNNVTAPIFIFSDDPEFVTQELGPLIPGEWTLVDAERKLSPSETLQLMAFGKYFVTANSTFSWWAATLSQSGPGQIIAPSKWFRNGPDPIDLIPDEWIRQQSIWVSI